MARRESTRVPSRSHRMVVMAVISPRLTHVCPHAPTARLCIKDYRHSLICYFSRADTNEGTAYPDGTRCAMRNAIFYVTYNGLYNFTNGIGTQTQLLISGLESIREGLMTQYGPIDVHVVCPLPDGHT